MSSRYTFLVYSQINSATISHSVGVPEYSYYFVLKDFLPLLEKLGDVRVLDDPAIQADQIYNELKSQNKKCLFLNFTAPQNMLQDIECPTVHVFAWEFDTIPTESWNNDIRNDWRVPLSALQSAITHSGYARTAIKNALGDDFPVAVIPCPVWDRMAGEREKIPARTPTKSASLLLEGRIYDTGTMEMFYDLKSWHALTQPETETTKFLQGGRAFVANLTKQILRQPIEDNAKAPATLTDAPTEAEIDIYTIEQTHDIDLNGIIYTSIFNPIDGRKNWQDMISAFIWAHKENKDAVLILKTPKLDVHDFAEPLTEFLSRFRPFNCRIIILMAFLDDAQYHTLLNATTYYVNTSFGEGQCLPLMEFLSAGIPALAPATTALEDYITDDISFVLPAHPEPSTWQHDPRLSYRALRWRTDWLELVDAYQRSYALAKTDPAKWQQMSMAAAAQMKNHCSLGAAEKNMTDYLGEIDAEFYP